MEKRIFTFIISVAMIVSLISGCGAKTEDISKENEQEIATVVEPIAENTSEVEEEITDDALKTLEAIGDVDVDKDLFDVTLNIPKDFVGETTQEKLDKSVEEKGYKSATLNTDGSVTFVMTKAQHKEMVDEIKKSIDKSISDMVGSSDYPNITDITANDDYTKFTVTTKNEQPDLAESFAVMGLYTCGGMYGIFAGEKVDNIHVDFVNDASGEIISSADSKNMGN